MKIRFQFDRAAVMGQGFIGLRSPLENGPKIIVGLGIVGARGQGATKTCFRLSRLAFGLPDIAQIVQGLGEFGVEPDRLIKTGRRIIQLA